MCVFTRIKLRLPTGAGVFLFFDYIIRSVIHLTSITKPFTSVEEQLSILKRRNLLIPDESHAASILRRNNYYTIINGYKAPFLAERSDQEERYIDGATFDEIYSLFCFDVEFRSLLLKYILKAEHELKSVISHVFAAHHESEKYPDYLDIKNFSVPTDDQRKYFNGLVSDITAKIDEQLEKNNQMLTHYKNQHNDIPPWILVSFLSFGMIRSFYTLLPNKEQNEIVRTFGLRQKNFKGYLAALNKFRNACAHDERIYNMVIDPVTRQGQVYRRVYVIILILKDMLDSNTFMSFYAGFNDILSRLGNNLHSIDIEEIYKAMGIPVTDAERKADLGLLNQGNSLSEYEFETLLTKYILPQLPTSAPILPVSSSDPNIDNAKCHLIEQINDRLYFSQSITNRFEYYVTISQSSIDNTQISTIEAHLSVLIDYVHVFWNLSNMSSFSKSKIRTAFPVLSEQAFELSICNLLCRDRADQAKAEYNLAREEHKRCAGVISPESLEQLRIDRDQKREVAREQAKLCSIAEQGIYEILLQFETWSIKTYEGQKKTFGIIFCKNEFSQEKKTFDYIEFLKTDFSATINDGIYSAVELYGDGSFKSHISIRSDIDGILPSIPYPFTGFADLCTKDKIGIILTIDGDILIINDRTLCYTKHNGHWIKCNAQRAINQIKTELELDDISKAELIYQAISDASFNRGGACLGIIQEESLPIDLEDQLEAGLATHDPKDKKVIALQTIITSGGRANSFYDINRYLRRELLELDGAMVLSKNGKIFVIGTIIKINGSDSDGGGRTAAAKQLSEYGLAIKVSQDGKVQFFRKHKIVYEMMT